jgi:hypothetical protein
MTPLRYCAGDGGNGQHNPSGQIDAKGDYTQSIHQHADSL